MSDAELDADLVADLELARRAALEAGRVALRAFGGPQRVWHKGPGQPVTPVDLEANAVLHAILGTERPDYAWLSEETDKLPDRGTAARVWIVDPLDGTRSYIGGRPEYSVSVGLALDGEPRVGVVLNPSTGELYLAVRGGGAWLERIDPTDATLAAAAEAAADSADSEGSPGPGRAGRTALGVTSQADATAVTLLASRSEIRAGEFAAFPEWSIVGLGSTAYKLARLAAGRGDVFFSRGPKSEWDLCAGVLLVEEAGGLVTDLDGRRVRFEGSAESVNGVLATNGRLHDAVVSRISRLPPPRGAGGDD